MVTEQAIYFQTCLLIKIKLLTETPNIATTAGRYKFSLFFVFTYGSARVDISMRIDGTQVHYFHLAQHTGSAMHDSRFFQMEADLGQGQKVSFHVNSMRNTPYYYSYSFLEGKLVSK